MDTKTATALQKMHYELVGSHSAVQICMWAKESLLDKDVCYKEKFYGIKSHRCCQMTPCFDCDQRCLFCWRPWELASAPIEKWDDPNTIIDGCITAQRKKLSGFGGNSKINKKKFEAAQNPLSFALSLSGEITLYPYLTDLIKELHRRNIITFLVTNGQHPEVLKKIELPTQLYVSVDAPTKEIYEKLDQPLNKDGWERLKKTLALLPDLDTRKVLRLTIIKGWNMSNIKEWAELVKLANPHFVEVKSYMHVGYSRKRMDEANMPTYEEVKDFSSKLAKELGWKAIDEQVRSRVVLLAKEDYSWRIMKFDA